MAEKRAGNRGKGRKKGVPNKTTLVVKGAIEFAYQSLGGNEAFAEWAKLNPGIFYGSILPKMLPKELTGQNGGAIQHKVTVVVKRDRNFFGRGQDSGADGSPVTDYPESGAVQDGSLRPTMGEDGAGADGSA